MVTDLVSSPVEDLVTSSLASSVVNTANTEDVSGRTEPSPPVEEASWLSFVCSVCCNPPVLRLLSLVT